MPTAYIKQHINYREGPCFIFEADPVVEVEYEVNPRDGLTEWHISDFRNDHYRYERTADGDYKPVKVAEVWCSDELRVLYLKAIDRTALEEALIEQLAMDGELPYINDELRADYHAAVL